MIDSAATSTNGASAASVTPQNLDAELTVLGAVMLENTTLGEVVEFLRPEHFYRGSNRTIFEAMIALAGRGAPIDFVTLTEELRRRGDLERIGGSVAVLDMATAVPSAANAADYGNIVREKALLRELIAAATSIALDAASQRVDVDELIDRAERAIFAIANRAETNKPQGLQSFVAEAFAQIEANHKNHGVEGGLATGFVDFDVLSGGLKPGELTIIAARPSMGKTTLALNIALHVGVDLGKTAAIFSLETPKKQIAQNFISMVARADVHKIRRGELPEADWDDLVRAAGKLAVNTIQVDDTPSLTPLALKAKARRIRAEHGLDLVVVDYLQLMESPGRSSDDNRQQEIATISRSLKALARELSVPVIAISQLNRGTDTRSKDERKPRLSDLRESGAIEQDADLVLFLFREEYYGETEANKGLAEVIVAKHRNGPTGIVRLAFQPQFLRFANLAHHGSLR